ncbi:MAG: hypothetical protein AB9836_02715 [Aminipila sp.]
MGGPYGDVSRWSNCDDYVDVQTYENLGNKTARQWAIDVYDPKR